jgi:mannose-1-phosphate guanylyltransferase / mannose-6-phosphate isomerase
MPIRGSPNGARHHRPQAGRDRPKWVVAINRNAWSQSIGIAGRDPPVRAVSAVAAFIEKPDPATARRYLADGYLWNSGNFLFRAEELLSELTRYEPAMVPAVEAAVAQATTDLGFLRLAAVPFAEAPKKSIDYAVMEKTSRAAVVEGRFRWSDIGSWDAVYAVSKHDCKANALHGPAIARAPEGDQRAQRLI